MREITWNDKVSAKRGPEWKKKLVAGRLDAVSNPTNLRKLRAKKALSQTTVANDVSLSLATYGAIERGKRLVRREMANKIAKTLRVKKADIFKQDGKKFIAI